MKRLLAVAAAVALWSSSCLYEVDQAELVYVTQFGRPVAAFDGDADAGLHVKWPWPAQSVLRLDRRVQLFDLPPVELLTHDAAGRTVDRTLVVEATVTWRIAGRGGIDRFVRTVGSPDQARAVLGQRVGNRVGAIVSALPMEDLIGVATPADVASRSARLRERLLGPTANEDDLRSVALATYGIELMDVGLRRFNYPASVRPAIAERIASERARKAAEYHSEGERRAAEITSAATRDAAIIEATAKAEAQRVQDRAAVEADRLRAKAHALDPEFYAFLQKLKTYQRVLNESRDVLLLSSRNELFDVLLKPPQPQAERKEGR